MDPNTLPELSQVTHSIDLQLRCNDIDILGHLNNTVYFSFFDTGKARFFEHIVDGNIDWKRVDVVIANIDCCYISPIFFGEDIRVYTRCMSISNKSFRLQQVLVEETKGVIKAAAETVMVSFDRETQKSVELPDLWRQALERSMA